MMRASETGNSQQIKVLCSSVGGQPPQMGEKEKHPPSGEAADHLARLRSGTHDMISAGFCNRFVGRCRNSVKQGKMQTLLLRQTSNVYSEILRPGCNRMPSGDGDSERVGWGFYLKPARLRRCPRVSMWWCSHSARNGTLHPPPPSWTGHGSIVRDTHASLVLALPTSERRERNSWNIFCA